MILIKSSATEEFTIEYFVNGKSNHKFWTHKIVKKVILTPKDAEPYGSETRYHGNVELGVDGRYAIELGLKYLDKPI